MKKTHLSKRALSMVLAVMMVVTMIPMGAFVAEASIHWTPVASSDFSQATISSATQWSGDSNKYDASVTAPAYIDGTNTIDWVTRVYQPTNYSYAILDDYDSDGTNDALYMDNGYMYMNMNQDGHVTTPLQGSTRFKIDFGFRYKYSNNDSYSDGKFTFMKLGAYGDTNNYIPGSNAQTANSTFVQDANGKIFSYDTKYADGSQARRIFPTGDSITTGTSYHYIVEYTGTRVRAYITDENYQMVLSLFNSTDSSTYRFSDIEKGLNSTDWPGYTYFKIGACDEGWYLRYLEYENITFYTGSTFSDSSVKAPTDSSSSTDKYLMTYFTGNTNDGERLRYAVSDDGINFHTLNKGNPVWDNSQSWTINQYPAGSQSGIATSKHVRDPYVFRANDGTYYILATDLDATGGTFSNGSKILVWHLTNLEDISTTTPWVIDGTVWKDQIAQGGAVKRFWAPQAIYDASVGKYMLYFSAGTGSLGSNPTNIYYIYTSDFQTFDGTPKMLIKTYTDSAANPDYDADITYNSSDDLYYMWYRCNNTIKCATATDCSGPYTQISNFTYQKTYSGSSHDITLEGPQVYQLKDGTYALLIDEFNTMADYPGDLYADNSDIYITSGKSPSKYGFGRLFTNSSVGGFAQADINTTTSIPYLYSRHCSVVRINNAEYEALISRYGDITKTDGTKVEYYFTGGSNQTGKSGWFGSVRDTGEHIFKLSFTTSGTGSYSATDGVFTLNDCGTFMEDTDLVSILRSSAFTVNFKCKITDADNLNYNIPIAAIGLGSGKDYIRLEADGDFYVNGTTKSDVFSPVANTEYNISISYNGQTVSVYVDGSFAGSLVLDEAIGSTCHLSLGYSDEYAGSGNMISAQYRDLSIVNTATSVGTDDDEALIAYAQDALDEYEDAMDGTVYRNMLPAYKAYVDLNEALDAVKYGQSATAQVVEAAKALNTATAAMTPWTAATATAEVENISSTNKISANHAKNILYSDKQTALVTEGSKKNVIVTIYYGNNTVVLYDGTNDIEIPVSVNYFYDDTGLTNYRKMGTMYPFKEGASGTWSFSNLPDDNDDFTLPGAWKGYCKRSDGSSPNDWDTNYYGSGNHFGQIPGYQKASGTKTDGGSDLPEGSRKEENNFSNYLVYVGGNSGFSSGLKTVQLDWIAYTFANKTSDGQVTHTLSNAGNIYVIDYSGVAAKIAEKDDYISSVTSYKEGGMIYYFTALDQLTTDVTGASYSSDPGTEAARVAGLISSGMSSIDSVCAALESSSDAALTHYVALRNAMDYSGCPTAPADSNILHSNSISVRDIIANNGSVTINGHTFELENYSYLLTAYNNAVSFMARLGTDNYNTNKSINYSNYGTDEGEAGYYAAQLMAAFNALDKHFTATYTSYGGTTTNKTIEAGCTLASATVPDNTATAYVANHQHYVYAWDTASSYVPWANITVTETRDLDDCSYDGGVITTDRKTFTCTDCGDSSYYLDLTSFRSECTNASGYIPQTMVYTAASLSTLNSAYTGGLSGLESATTQGEIDAYTGAIQTAISGLVYIDYNITVNVYENGSKNTALSTAQSTTKHYSVGGTVAYDGELSVYKWERTTGGNTTTYNISTPTMDYVTAGDTVYNIYAASDNHTEDECVKVQMISQTGNVSDIVYVPAGNYTVSTSDNVITLTGTNSEGTYTLTAQNKPFYSITGFTFNSDDLGATVDISDDSNFKAVYTPSSMTITYDGCYRLGNPATQGTSPTTKWDERIYVTADGANENTAWIVNGEIVGYGAVYSFRVTQTTVVSCTASTAQAAVSLNYFSYGVTRAKTLTFVGSYYVPDSWTINAYGIKYLTDRTATAATTTMTGADVISRGTTKIAGTHTDSNQYVLNITRSASTTMAMAAVAYLDYTDDNSERQTIYSAVKIIDVADPE